MVCVRACVCVLYLPTVHLNAADTHIKMLQCAPQNIHTNTCDESTCFTFQICHTLRTIATDIILKKSTQNKQHSQYQERVVANATLL